MTPSHAARRRTTRLLRHHLPIATGVGLALIAIVWSLASDDPTFRWSMATAYVSLVLLIATLSVGPLQTIRGRRVPSSLDLRRDLGIWAGLIGIAHAGVGAFVHMRSPWLYVFEPRGFPESLSFRTDLFGLANYLGLAAVLVLGVLLATSNDRSIKRLRPRRWKSIQRFAYGLVVTVFVHAWVYQVLEDRPTRYVLVVSALALVLGALQVAGVVSRRRRSTAHV